ncbi:MAG: tyrosine--tRNA ligase [Acidimicrobiia bacterium]|nr:tyrosine--tRNA ligase [Acidimicrobiia bacterium]
MSPSDLSAPRPGTAAVLDDLEARGLVQDTSERAELAARLARGPITLYYGCDPTADSLHAGNLIGLLVLRRFQRFGHRPIALAGGATGMIGDPSGRSDERNLLSDDILAANIEQIVPQLRRFVDFDDGPAQARLHDNRSWTLAMSTIDFLRDVGKHVTVNQMLAKEAVRSRLSSAHGISYTEFSYMLLQANDYVQLAELEGCELQIGGSDQWGNIALGIDLVRRRTGRTVHGWTWPLLTKADGTKYGKTASGDQIWLGAHRMSPYRFYQAWMQAEDGDVRTLLLQLTFLEPAEVDDVVAEHEARPESRLGQRRLSTELTAIVHGEAEAGAAQAASDVLFGGDPTAADEATLAMVAGEVPRTDLPRHRFSAPLDPVDLLVEVGLASSRGDARRTIEQRGLAANNVKLEPGSKLGEEDLLHGRYLLLRKGRANYQVIVAASG